MNDLKFAFRALRKSPGFAVISILTLALGIGLNTSMFSLMNLLLLQPLPYPNRDQLVRVYRTTAQSQTMNHAAADWIDIDREGGKFMDPAAFRLWGFTLKRSNQPAVNLNGLRVSGGFFRILGLQPELGRIFTAEEDHPGNHVVILSHNAWQTHFGGDRSIVGQTVRVDDEPTVVVGVMPEKFSSIFLWGPGDAFRPLALTQDERTNRNDGGYQIIARRLPGISLDQANARLSALAEWLDRSRPHGNSQDGLRAVSLQSSVLDPTTARVTFLLLGLSGFVLLIVCANLANLQLSRAMARKQEYAICAALGASRSRLLRPLLAESLLLSLAGGAGGLIVALWSNDWLSSRLSANGFVVFKLALDWRVMAFALVVSVFTGLVFGIVPAWMMSRVRFNDALKSGARGSTGDPAQHRFRHALIVGQFSLALTLLAGAGLFVQGIGGMLARDLGWDTRDLLQCILNLPETRYASPAQTYSFYTRLRDRIAAIPGVENVAIGWTVPVFQFLNSQSFVVEGREAPPPGHEPIAFENGVMPSYFDTLKIRLTAGRNFTDSDGPSATPVAIIDESMARALFPNQSPLGRRIGGLDPAHRAWLQIVGVMPDQQTAIGIAPPATRFEVFLPLAQETWNYVTVAVRSPNPGNLSEPLRRAIADLDPDIPVQQLSTVKQMIGLGSSGLNMVSTILVAFAFLGLFLSALGLYGVIERLVWQRTPEIGLRLALGAQAGNVLWLVMGSGLRLIVAGTIFGLLGSYGLAWMLAKIAPAFSMHSPLAMIVAILLLTAVALLACWLPARRATKVDPLVALRGE
jgi:predicted permease